MINFVKNLSPLEIGIIALIFLVLFGRKAFVSLGRTSGETLKEIKDIKKNFTEAVSDETPAKTEKEVSK